MVCGPLCSACMMFTCLWGAIFLGIVGLLFQQESVGLIADLPGGGAKDTNPDTVTTQAPTTDGTARERVLQEQAKLRDDFKNTAMNVWIAAAAHAVTFVLAVGRFMMVKNRL
uniref:Uncharacterized protein n=1 Tax=Plectus sambesii TaxID=2011161 RepID=A0A914VDE7_9BILA